MQGSVGNLRGRKQLAYEGGQRVPMIIYGKPFVLVPTVTGAMATNLDIFPTLLDLLKVEMPSDRIIDEKSMLLIITKNEKSTHNYIFYNAAISGNVVGVRGTLYKYHEGANGIHVNLLGN